MPCFSIDRCKAADAYKFLLICFYMLYPYPNCVGPSRRIWEAVKILLSQAVQELTQSLSSFSGKEGGHACSSHSRSLLVDAEFPCPACYNVSKNIITLEVVV